MITFLAKICETTTIWDVIDNHPELIVITAAILVGIILIVGLIFVSRFGLRWKGNVFVPSKEEREGYKKMMEEKEFYTPPTYIEKTPEGEYVGFSAGKPEIILWGKNGWTHKDPWKLVSKLKEKWTIQNTIILAELGFAIPSGIIGLIEERTLTIPKITIISSLEQRDALERWFAQYIDKDNPENAKIEVV